MFTVEHLHSSPYFRSMHPAEKLLFAAVQVLLCCIFAHWQICALSAAVSICLLMLASPSRLLTVRMLAAPAAFLLPACMSVALEVDSAHYWWHFSVFSHCIGITDASGSAALLLFAKAFAASSALIAAAVATPVHQIEYLFCKLGMPPVLVDLFGMIYRFIGLLLSVLMQILMAQQARAQTVRWGGRIRGAGLAASALLRKALWYQQWASYSAQARGYTGKLAAGTCEAELSYIRLLFIVLYAGIVAAGALLLL